MKIKPKLWLTVIWIVVALGSLSSMVAGCGTTRTYKMPYSLAERLLFEHLHIDKDATLRNPHRVQARAEEELERSMSMKLFANDLHASTPGESLSFTCHHLYDIGAVGGEYILFELRKRDEDTTRIKVDYCDRWWGVWPPFVFWNPGLARERNIHNEIWGKGSSSTPWYAQTFSDPEAVGRILFTETGKLHSGKLRPSDLLPALKDKRILFVDDCKSVAVRDVAFGILDEGGGKGLPQGVTPVFICGCKVDGQWYRYHVPLLTDEGFSQTIKAIQHGDAPRPHSPSAQAVGGR